MENGASSFCCMYLKAGVDFRGGELGRHLQPPLFQMPWGPYLRVSHLDFALFCLKPDQPLWGHIFNNL